LTKYPEQSYVQLLNTIRDELRGKYDQKPQLSASHRESWPLDSLYIAHLHQLSTRAYCLSPRYVNNVRCVCMQILLLLVDLDCDYRERIMRTTISRNKVDPDLFNTDASSLRY
jgi:hypothetical protein